MSLFSDPGHTQDGGTSLWAFQRGSGRCRGRQGREGFHPVLRPGLWITAPRHPAVRKGIGGVARSLAAPVEAQGHGPDAPRGSTSKLQRSGGSKKIQFAFHPEILGLKIDAQIVGKDAGRLPSEKGSWNQGV